ncbi:hypothetical protein D3C80_1470310 [compost metagenome]
MRVYLKIVGAAIAPKIPAIKTAIIVIETFPPKPLATSIATGVVRDLGMRERVNGSLNPNIFANKPTLIIPEMAPTKTPPKIGKKCLIKKCRCLYKG